VPLQLVVRLMFRGVDEFIRVRGDNLSCHAANSILCTALGSRIQMLSAVLLACRAVRIRCGIVCLSWIGRVSDCDPGQSLSGQAFGEFGQGVWRRAL